MFDQSIVPVDRPQSSPPRVVRWASIALLASGSFASLPWSSLYAQSAPPFASQESSQPVDMRRAGGGKTLLKSAAIGALTGSALAMGYYYMSERGDRATGCQPLNCAMPFLTGSGAIAGLFIGRELHAARRALGPRTGETARFELRAADVLAEPASMDVRDSLIAVVSDSGAQLFSGAPQSPKALRRRAAGLSAMRYVAIVPLRQSIVLGTGTALWEANLVNGPATRLADGAVDALAASGDAILSASGRTLRLTAGIGAETRIDSLTLPELVAAIAYDSTAAAFWVATDSQLVQIKNVNGAISRSGMTLPIPAAARAIATNGTWIAVALGGDGVMAWRREALGAPVLRAVRITQDPRFAYDLAFLGDVLYVAGGTDGLYELALEPEGRVVSSSRQLSFVTLVRSSNGALWAGDRNTKSLVRVTPKP